MRLMAVLRTLAAMLKSECVDNSANVARKSRVADGDGRVMLRATDPDGMVMLRVTEPDV